MLRITLLSVGFNYFFDGIIFFSLLFVGASFRNIGEILNLAGCDRLTIAPSLLEELKNSTADVPRLLGPTSEGAEYKGAKISTDEKSFRYSLNADAMATEKLAEGIRGFCVDIEKLEIIIKGKMMEQMSNDQ
jgi:transaldolase